MPIYSRYIEKKLVYIIITVPFSRQPFSCSKYTKLNMRLSCDIQLVLDIKYAFLLILSLSHPNSSVTWQYMALLARHYIL